MRVERDYFLSSSYSYKHFPESVTIPLPKRQKIPDHKYTQQIRTKRNQTSPKKRCSSPLRSLSRLLGTNQRNDSRQLGRLIKLLMLDIVVDILACCNLLADLQHTVLQRQQLSQRVIEEGRTEGDIGGRLARGGNPHFQLSRGLASLLGSFLGLRRRPVQQQG